MDSATPLRGPLVIGLGSPDRGDDAVGPVVASAIEGLGLPGVRVVTHEDPTALIHLWADEGLVVVIDAVVSGSAPGTITIRETGIGSEALPPSAWEKAGRGGTHAFGLASAVELARTLGRLPSRVVLVGIEAASFGHGEDLTPAVAAAVPEAASTVRGILSDASLRSVS